MSDPTLEHTDSARRGVLVAAAALPACLAALFILSPGPPEAPCQDERPEDVGRALPDVLAPLVPADTPYCAMLAGLSRVEFHTNASTGVGLERLDARMRAAGATPCGGVEPRPAARCYVHMGVTIEATGHVDPTSPPTLVLHVTRELVRSGNARREDANLPP